MVLKKLALALVGLFSMPVFAALAPKTPDSGLYKSAEALALIHVGQNFIRMQGQDGESTWQVNCMPDAAQTKSPVNDWQCAGDGVRHDGGYFHYTSKVQWDGERFGERWEATLRSNGERISGSAEFRLRLVHADLGLPAR